jgi:mRNA-degrading endonuclease RelE of RelBE toxin-antitoxin system
MVISIDEIVYTSKFENDARRLKEKGIKHRLEKNIRKVIENPEIGKPLSYALKGERTIRIPPFRFIHSISENRLILLRFEHSGNVYD